MVNLSDEAITNTGPLDQFRSYMLTLVKTRISVRVFFCVEVIKETCLQGLSVQAITASPFAQKNLAVKGRGLNGYD